MTTAWWHRWTSLSLPAKREFENARNSAVAIAEHTCESHGFQMDGAFSEKALSEVAPAPLWQGSYNTGFPPLSLWHMDAKELLLESFSLKARRAKMAETRIESLSIWTTTLTCPAAMA